MKIVQHTTKAVLTALILLSACVEDPGMEGPLLEDLYGDFTLLEDLDKSMDEVDFAQGERIYFSARFNKTTNWELRLNGLTSGAEKLIEGFSSEVDQSNSEWDGTASTPPFFRAEKVVVSLYIPEDSLTLTDTVQVLSPKVHEGFLVTDFESGENSGWEVFKQSGGQMSFVIDDADIAAQGQYYYDMGGEVNWDWLIGYIYIPSSSFPDSVLNGGTTLPLPSNPNQVFLNMLVYSPPGINNELLLIRINEDDNLDGNYNGGTEDQWSVELREVQDGWSVVSLRYSDLQALIESQPVNPAGNGLHEPDKIDRIEFLFLANPSSGYSQMYMDYIIFTEGGPLEP